MKNLFTLLILMTCTATLWAQSFSDDFESYNEGEYIGVQSDIWTTWDGQVGGSEDAQIVTDQAYSGTNSIHLVSTSSTGGPQDIILPVGNNLNNGILTIGSRMYVKNGKVGYFNFQANTTPGQVWTLDFSAENGVISLTEGGAPLASATYTPETWFEWEIVANMTFNIWKLYIDGNLVGTFSSGANQVASVDIFGITNASFWVDDVHYDWEALTLPEMNLSAVSLKDMGILSGLSYHPTAVVRNNGTTAITSFDIAMDYNGNNASQSISGVNLAPGEYFEVPFTDDVILDSGDQEVDVTVSNVNGMASDDYPEDDTYQFLTNLSEPALGKRAVVEEGTGTWCQYCPRGAVTMARLNKIYGDYFTGIAVHNSDPMAVEIYDTGMNLNAYPSGKVDRSAQLADGDFESNYIQRMMVAPHAYVSVGAQYNAETRFLQVVVSADCIADDAGIYKLGLVVVEDSVTGTTSGYNQSNAFSGGDAPVGGYEDLPNPVPASMMIYDHVGRSILPDFNGAEDIVPNPIVNGETYAVNFEMTLPESWDVDQIELAGLFFKSNRIDNSFKASLAAAIDSGWYDSGNLITGIDRLPEPDATVKLYPNPSTNMSYLDLGLKTADAVSVTVLTTDGKIVSSRDYGVLNGAMRLPINTSRYAKGLYFVRVRIGNTQMVKKLLVE